MLLSPRGSVKPSPTLGKAISVLAASRHASGVLTTSKHAFHFLHSVSYSSLFHSESKPKSYKTFYLIFYIRFCVFSTLFCLYCMFLSLNQIFTFFCSIFRYQVHHIILLTSSVVTLIEVSESLIKLMISNQNPKIYKFYT